MNPKFVLSIALLAALGSSAVIRKTRQFEFSQSRFMQAKLYVQRASDRVREQSRHVHSHAHHVEHHIRQFQLQIRYPKQQARRVQEQAHGTSQSPNSTALPTTTRLFSTIHLQSTSTRLPQTVNPVAQRINDKIRENTEALRSKNGSIGEIEPKPLQTTTLTLATTRFFSSSQPTQTAQPVIENSKSIDQQARENAETAKQKAHENIDDLQEQAHENSQSLSSTTLPNITRSISTNGTQSTAAAAGSTRFHLATNTIAQAAKVFNGWFNKFV